MWVGVHQDHQPTILLSTYSRTLSVYQELRINTLNYFGDIKEMVYVTQIKRF